MGSRGGIIFDDDQIAALNSDSKISKDVRISPLKKASRSGMVFEDQPVSSGHKVTPRKTTSRGGMVFEDDHVIVGLTDTIKESSEASSTESNDTKIHANADGKKLDPTLPSDERNSGSSLKSTTSQKSNSSLTSTVVNTKGLNSLSSLDVFYNDVSPASGKMDSAKKTHTTLLKREKRQLANSVSVTDKFAYSVETVLDQEQINRKNFGEYVYFKLNGTKSKSIEFSSLSSKDRRNTCFLPSTSDVIISGIEDLAHYYMFRKSSLFAFRLRRLFYQTEHGRRFRNSKDSSNISVDLVLLSLIQVIGLLNADDFLNATTEELVTKLLATYTEKEHRRSNNEAGRSVGPTADNNKLPNTMNRKDIRAASKFFISLIQVSETLLHEYLGEDWQNIEEISKVNSIAFKKINVSVDLAKSYDNLNKLQLDASSKKTSKSAVPSSDKKKELPFFELYDKDLLNIAAALSGLCILFYNNQMKSESWWEEYKQASTKLYTRLVFAIVNVDENPKFAAHYKITLSSSGNNNNNSNSNSNSNRNSNSSNSNSNSDINSNSNSNSNGNSDSNDNSDSNGDNNNNNNNNNNHNQLQPKILLIRSGQIRAVFQQQQQQQQHKNNPLLMHHKKLHPKGTPPLSNTSRSAEAGGNLNRHQQLSATNLVTFIITHDNDVKSNHRLSGIQPSPQPDMKGKLGQKLLKNKTQGKLSRQREFVTLTEKFKALGTASQSKNREDPPTIFFMGGGMGSGKSSTVDLLKKTEFWQLYGKEMVVIEADAMKMKDPVFQSLVDIDSSASRFVHKFSVQAAEDLFLTAIRDRRDILFDGTMMWEPFVRQTVEMLRDREYIYKRGPGYNPTDKVEVYWEKDHPVNQGKPSTEPLPSSYRLIMVGVTTPPEVAVNRGIVRKIITGRGVPIASQLRSHLLFSEAFEKYVAIFDQVMLYDNGDLTNLLAVNPAEPILIALKMDFDEQLQVDPIRYKSFIDKAQLNSRAKKTADLYKSKDVTSNTPVIDIAQSLEYVRNALNWI